MSLWQVTSVCKQLQLLAGHVRTQAAPPLPPDLLQASAVSPSSFKLSWHAPESQGAPVTDYSVRIQPSSALASGHVTDLPNGRPLQNGHADTLHTLSKASGHDMPHSNGDMPSNPQGRVIRVKGTQLSTTVTGGTPFVIV